MLISNELSLGASTAVDVEVHGVALSLRLIGAAPATQVRGRLGLSNKPLGVARLAVAGKLDGGISTPTRHGAESP